MMTMNAGTFLNITRALVPAMVKKGSGKIVTVGAIGAVSGQGNMGAYGAAKSSLMRLTESLSAEVKKQGINVNCVMPSMIDTPANRDAMPDADFSTWVSKEDLANVICFLGSEKSRAIHGAMIPISGLL